MTGRRAHTFIERRQHEDALNRTAATSVRPGADPDSAWLEPVISATPTPPGSPAAGDRYLIDCGATGLWSGHDTEIAEWNGEEWLFTIPMDGDTLWIMDVSYHVTFVDLADGEVPFFSVTGTSEFWVPAHLIDEGHSIFPVLAIDKVTALPTASSVAKYATYLLNSVPDAPYGAYGDHLAISVCDPDEGRIWVFIAPEEGRLVMVADEDFYYIYEGAAYNEFHQHLAALTLIGELSDVEVAGAADCSLLKYDSATGDWEDITLTDLAALIALGDLKDVDDSAAAVGSFLYRNDNDGGTDDYSFKVPDCDDVTNASTAPGATVCAALTDHETRISDNETDITTNAGNITTNAGDITTLQGAGVGAHALNDHTDVSGSPSTGDLLEYTGSGWTPQAPSGGGGGGGGVLAGSFTANAPPTILSGSGFTLTNNAGNIQIVPTVALGGTYIVLVLDSVASQQAVPTLIPTGINPGAATNHAFAVLYG